MAERAPSGSAQNRHDLCHPLLDLVVRAERRYPGRRVPAGSLASRALLGDGAVGWIHWHGEVHEVDVLDAQADVLKLDAVRPDQLERILDVHAALSDEPATYPGLLQHLTDGRVVWQFAVLDVS